jgi:hypothetical protein
LTVLGTLTTKGDRDIAKVNAAGPLVTYLLRLDSGGGGFGGDVILIGSLPSKFGGQAVFDGNLTARGTVIIDAVTFNKGATFNGPVEFIGPEGSVIIGESQKVILNGAVTISNANPVNVLGGQFEAGDALPGYTYNDPITFGSTAANYGTLNVTKPVTFNSTVDLSAVHGTFAAVTFGDTVSFGNDKVYKFGTYDEKAPGNKTTFAKDPDLDYTQLYEGKFDIPVTFNGDATFTGGSVNFNKAATFNGNLTLSDAAGTFGGGAVFNKAVTFAAGSQVTIGANTTLRHSSSGLVLSGISGLEGSIIPDATAGIVLTDGGTLQVAGTLTLGSTSIDIGNGVIRIDAVGTNSGIVFGGAQTGVGYVVSEAYTVKAGTSQGGTVVGLFGTVTSASIAEYVTLTKAGFSGDGSGSQATLRVAGSYANTASNIEVSKDITIDGVTIDFEAASSAGSLTVKGSPVITLKGGKGVAVGGGTVYAGAAGGIRSGPAAAVYGGKAGTANTSADFPSGYLVGLGGKLVAGTASGTYSEALAGSLGSLGTNETNAAPVITTNGDVGFAVYPETVLDIAGVRGILNSTGTAKRFVESGIGGSVAVFAGTLTE